MAWTAAAGLSVEEAVLPLLRDPEWAAWSDHEIARRCGVSQSLVTRARPPVTDAKHQLDRQRLLEVRTYRDKHGNTTTMNTAGINAHRALPAVEMARVWADAYARAALTPQQDAPLPVRVPAAPAPAPYDSGGSAQHAARQRDRREPRAVPAPQRGGCVQAAGLLKAVGA
jgi:hypothetical protein